MTQTSGRSEVLERLSVSRETIEDLDLFVALLQRWQGVKNLIAPSTLNEIWARHVLDSAQLLPLAGTARRIMDLGSGAGFPGMVLAILLKGQPGAEVHLVESNGRKASFLREAARETGAVAIIHAERIETVVQREKALDAVTARALAPLPELLSLSEPLLRSGAVGLFLKGRSAAQELTDSRKSWRIDAELIPSVTDSSASVVVIRSAERIGPRA